MIDFRYMAPKKIKLQKLHTYWLKAVSYGLILSFVLSSVFGTLSLLWSPASAAELIEEAFMPSKTHETIINLGNTKDAVGNEILRESVGLQNDLGQWCFVQGQKIDGNEVKRQVCEIRYSGTYKGKIGASNDKCTLPSWTKQNVTNSEKQEFCATVLWGNRDDSPATVQAPLIVRITKFLLRITIVLSITMVIYSGIMYIIEASKGAEVKETTNNLMYIIGWVLLALMSLGLINLIASLSVSSLGVTSQKGCLIDGAMVAFWEPLKQYVCEKSFYGKWYGDRVGKRCRVNYYKDNPNGNFGGTDRHRASITDSEQSSKCFELWGEWK